MSDIVKFSINLRTKCVFLVMFRPPLPPCTHLYALVLTPPPPLDAYVINGRPLYIYIHSFLIECFTSYFMFSIAVILLSPGVVYYQLLLRREPRIPEVAPFSFRIGFWDFCVHYKGTEILYIHSLWDVVNHSRIKMHETCLIIFLDPGMRPGPESNRGP